MIEEQFVLFDTARMLKEAGFDVVIRSHYTQSGSRWETVVPESVEDRNGIVWFPRPTQALAARWLREGHGLFIEIFYRITGFNYEIIYTRTDDVAFTPHEPKINFISYEECLEDALQEAIKLIKK